MALQLAKNKRHIYRLGQLFTCSCESKVWTNSVRNEEALLAYLTGQTDRYYNGFCNDAFCGYCLGYFQPLKNGYLYQGKRLDLYGCPKCPKNQSVVVDGDKKDEENDHEWLMAWYRRHLEELKRGI